VAKKLFATAERSLADYRKQRTKRKQVVLAYQKLISASAGDPLAISFAFYRLEEVRYRDFLKDLTVAMGYARKAGPTGKRLARAIRDLALYYVASYGSGSKASDHLRPFADQGRGEAATYELVRRAVAMKIAHKRAFDVIDFVKDVAKRGPLEQQCALTAQLVSVYRTFDVPKKALAAVERLAEIYQTISRGHTKSTTANTKSTDHSQECLNHLLTSAVETAAGWKRRRWMARDGVKLYTQLLSNVTKDTLDAVAAGLLHKRGFIGACDGSHGLRFSQLRLQAKALTPLECVERANAMASQSSNPYANQAAMIAANCAAADLREWNTAIRKRYEIPEFDQLPKQAPKLDHERAELLHSLTRGLCLGGGNQSLDGARKPALVKVAYTRARLLLASGRAEEALVAYRELALRVAPEPLGAKAAYTFLRLGSALAERDGRNATGACSQQLEHESKLAVRLYCEMEVRADAEQCGQLRRATQQLANTPALPVQLRRNEAE